MISHIKTIEIKKDKSKYFCHLTGLLPDVRYMISNARVFFGEDGLIDIRVDTTKDSRQIPSGMCLFSSNIKIGKLNEGEWVIRINHNNNWIERFSTPFVTIA